MDRYKVMPRPDGKWALVTRGTTQPIVLFDKYDRVLAFVDTLPPLDRATVEICERKGWEIPAVF